MSQIDLTRFHRTFFEESFEGLDAMEAGLLRLDEAAGPESHEALNAIFRAAHSIKGGAASFGFSGIADFTHGVETLLDRMRGGRRTVAQADLDLLLKAVDVIRGLLTATRDGGDIDLAAVAETQRRLRHSLDGDAAVPAAGQSKAPPASGGWRIRFIPRPDLFRSGNDPLRILRSLAELGPLSAELDPSRLPSFSDAEADGCYLGWTLTLQGEAARAEVEECFAWVEDECETLVIEALAAAPPAAAVEPATAAAAPKPALSVIAGGRSDARGADSGSIRVATDKIDLLINLVGELVITQAMLAQAAGSLDPVANEKLVSGLQQLDRNTRDLQEAVMSTRMLPMESVFSRFPRLVRDLAAKLGKRAGLQTVGEATELDKSVIEKISDPLNHLVRNSLDHGIEPPEERVAAGKPAEGTIRLSAAHQGGHIVIQVIDDGRGLSRERILAKARAQELAVSEAMSDAEVWQLIFAPGFSTAEQVTDVSGRGVGMDVVRQNIQSLGGQVDVASVAGQGTTVSIRLPLTLAILDGMSVRVGEEIFIVPLSAVVESLQPRAEQLRSVTGTQELVRVRDEYLSLLPLHRLFGIPSTVQRADAGILVLLEAEGRKVAVLVDELVGQQQVVIKSLETNYRRVTGISGATILGDGRVALILDAGALVRSVSQAQAA